MEFEKGKDRADRYDDIARLANKKELTHFLGGKITVKPASEPSDIIWENRKFSEKSRKTKKVFTCLILIFVLAGSFSVIFFASKKNYELTERYPPVECDAYEHEYKDLEKWKIAAIGEYTSNKDMLEKEGGNPIYSGPMQCFCMHQEEAGISDDEIYHLKDSNGTVVVNAPICRHYADDLGAILWLTIAVTVVIVVVNIILEMVVHNLVEWVGQDTISN